MADRLQPPKSTFSKVLERFYTVWYVRSTTIHADKKQQAVKLRRAGRNCFEVKNPELFGMILHDLRHGAGIHEVMAYYKVPCRPSPLSGSITGICCLSLIEAPLPGLS